MDRREFFHPRQLAEHAGGVLAVLDELADRGPESLVEEYALLRASRLAMATAFDVFLPYGTPDGAAICSRLLDEVDRLEQQLTVYRPDSEVSLLNREAFRSPIQVEERLFGLFRLAAEIHAETEGAFDIAAGALIKAWGFFKPPRRVPNDSDRIAAMMRSGQQHVLLDDRLRTIRFLREGVEINLGSIGKGYALDRVGELARNEYNLSSVLLHGGHSSVYAIGSAPGTEEGWCIGVRHPWSPDRRLAVVRLKNLGMGTSAATFRHLEYKGKKLGHILDPRKGWPAEGVASATAIAPTAAMADALATAFFILGVEKTREYCERHPETGAILLPEGEDDELLTLGAAASLVLPPGQPRSAAPRTLPEHGEIPPV